MIEAAVKSSVILLMALGALPLLRRQSAALRHAILTVGLVCALAVPVLSPLIPSWRPDEKFGVRPLVPLFASPEVLNGKKGNEWSDTEFLPQSRKIPSTAAVVFGVWVSGMSVAGIVLLAGIARIVWLARRAKPLSSRLWTVAAAEVSHALGLRRRVRIMQNERAVLGTWGILRPRILLPVDADSWLDDRVRVVLTHELAHIKRLDWLVQMLAEFARAACWFNPLFWIVCRKLRMESEHACDDAVLNTGIDAKDYAAHLLDLARTLKHSGRAWAPVLAMAQPPHLERRFVAMLNPALNHRSASRAKIFVVVVAAACVTLPLAAMRAPEQTIRTAAPIHVLVAASAPAAEAKPPVPAPIMAKKPAASKPAAALPTHPTHPTQGLLDGSLSGTVSDATGAVIPGVTVTVSSLVRQPSTIVETPVLSTTTGEAGKFEFPALTAGDYSLKAELPGFVSYRKAWLTVKPSQASRDNVVLSVGTITQKVEVTVAGRPRPPAPAGTPQRIRVGGNVVAATLISQVKPIYPQSVRDAGIEGTVHLQGVIGADGSLLTVRVVSSNDRDLANAALESVRQWRYRPTLLNNEPVEVLTDIEVEFKLAY